MPTLTSLNRGENILLHRQLFTLDNVTPIPVTDVQSLSVVLSSVAGVVRTLVLGTDPELRALDATTFEVEITKAISASLPVGRLKETWKIETANASFVVDGGSRHDVVEIEELLVK